MSRPFAGSGVDVLTVSDTAATLKIPTETQIATFAAVGIDVLDAPIGTGDCHAGCGEVQCVGQLALFVRKLVSLTDTGNALSGLTAAQVAFSPPRASNIIYVSNNALNLSVAQLESASVGGSTHGS